MNVDEMILRASKDGKFYVNNQDGYKYHREIGFVGPKGQAKLSVRECGWQEEKKRHLTISEAEIELDCEIDTPDISKLLRPMTEKPDDIRNIIMLFYDGCTCNGYYSIDRQRWLKPTGELIYSHFYWIDPADLIKLLPKE